MPTPRFILYGLGSAANCSVSPRIGSRAASSTAENSGMCAFGCCNRVAAAPCARVRSKGGVGFAVRLERHADLATFYSLTMTTSVRTAAGDPQDQATAAVGRFAEFPVSPFQLFQPYAPAGDQSYAIARLA